MQFRNPREISQGCEISQPLRNFAGLRIFAAYEIVLHLFDLLTFLSHSLFFPNYPSCNSGQFIYFCNFACLGAVYMSRPDSRSDPIGGSEPSSGCETIYWDSLPFFFFITESKYHIQIQKNYHRSGVHQYLYTYTESHLHIQKLYFLHLQIRAQNIL